MRSIMGQPRVNPKSNSSGPIVRQLLSRLGGPEIPKSVRFCLSLQVSTTTTTAAAATTTTTTTTTTVLYYTILYTTYYYHH